MDCYSNTRPCLLLRVSESFYGTDYNYNYGLTKRVGKVLFVSFPNTIATKLKQKITGPIWYTSFA